MQRDATGLVRKRTGYGSATTHSQKISILIRARLSERTLGREQVRGPRDLAALQGFPDTAHLDQATPLSRGHPDLDRRTAIRAHPAGGVRRAGDRDGNVLTTLARDILDRQIQTIGWVINPDKIKHLGPVADAWAVLREANQARRPTD